MDYDDIQFPRWAKLPLALLILLGIGAVLVRLTCFTFIDNYEIGYKYSYWGGGIERIKGNGPDGRGGGYIFLPFWKGAVHTVDMRPMQVCINANQRVLNCKLVQFNPDGKDPETGQNGLELFLSWHGRQDYDGPSTSSGQGENNQRIETTTFSEILKSYAYEGSGKTYPFLTIIRDMKSDQNNIASNQSTGAMK